MENMEKKVIAALLVVAFATVLVNGYALTATSKRTTSPTAAVKETAADVAPAAAEDPADQPNVPVALISDFAETEETSEHVVEVEATAIAPEEAAVEPEESEPASAVEFVMDEPEQAAEEAETPVAPVAVAPAPTPTPVPAPAPAPVAAPAPAPVEPVAEPTVPVEEVVETAEIADETAETVKTAEENPQPAVAAVKARGARSADEVQSMEGKLLLCMAYKANGLYIYGSNSYCVAMNGAAVGETRSITVNGEKINVIIVDNGDFSFIGDALDHPFFYGEIEF